MRSPPPATEKLYRAVMPSDELDLCQRNRNFEAIATLLQSPNYDRLRLDNNSLVSFKRRLYTHHSYSKIMLPQ